MNNSNSFILTTSGFILPYSPYYIILSPDKITDTSILNRNQVTTTDNNISEFIKSNVIYQSEVANNAYKSYLYDQSFSNYVNMIDISIDILSNINFNTFFEIQASNRNLSPVAFMFCLDLVSGNLPTKFKQYLSLPLFTRFNSNKDVSNEYIIKNKSLLKANMKNNTTWHYFISDLADYREAFSIFFSFLFVDAYS